MFRPEYILNENIIIHYYYLPNTDEKNVNISNTFNFKKIKRADWYYLSQNPNAIPILEQNIEKINWFGLSWNPNAIHLLEQNMEKVNWNCLSENQNAIPLLEKNMDKISWVWLSGNPNAIHLLEQNMDKVYWPNLSHNPNAIHLLEQNMEKVDWRYCLYANPNAIHLFARLDTEKMRENCKTFARELAEYVFHPTRLLRLCDAYGLELEEYFECV